MKLPGQTDLDQLPDLPPQLRAQLRNLWIDGVEEFLALLATIDPTLVAQILGAIPATLNASRQSAAALIGPHAIAASQSKTGGPLGCKIDPKLLALVQAEGELRPRRTRPITAPRPALPRAARLIDRIGPPKDQGSRGTCVAFSAVALRECIAGKNHPLSEQFLYWACKELDGLDDEGTFIHTAMTALSRLGVCPANIWPYVPLPIPGNESQGPPAAAALQAALPFRMDNTRTVEPSYIDQYKQILAGSPHHPGAAPTLAMPIAFAVLVFNSWYASSQTHRTGKITMPLPGEKPLPGGHAMCIVGYVDDETVPGGGYFIVRNSWGTQWAAESPEAPGHALMPYAYAERFTVEAFTGPSAALPESTLPSNDPLARYLRRLPSDGRDLEEKRLPAGTAVLANPAAPSEWMEDTPDNRRKFAASGFAWSPAARAAVLMPPADALPASFNTQWDQAAAARQQFLNAIDANLKAAVKTVFPEANLPTLCNFLLWDPRVKRVTEPADLSAQVATLLRQAAGVAAELSDPSGWDKRWRDAATTRIYSLRGSGGAHIHVVASFVLPLTLAPTAAPTLRAPTAHTLDLLGDAYRAWLQTHPEEKPQFTFCTVGTLLPWADDLQPTASGHTWTTIASPAPHPSPDAPAWTTRNPPRFAQTIALRNFTDRLKPETRQQRISRLKSVIDDLLLLYEGNVDIDLIARKTADRRTNIQETFFELQKQGHYTLYKTPDHRTAIRTESGNASPQLKPPSAKTGHFSYYLVMVVLLVISLVALWLKDLFFSSQHVWALLALVPVMYITKLVDRKLNHLIESREKE